MGIRRQLDAGEVGYAAESDGDDDAEGHAADHEQRVHGPCHACYDEVVEQIILPK